MKAQMEFQSQPPQQEAAPKPTAKQTQKPVSEAPKQEVDAEVQSTPETQPETTQSDKKRPWEKLKAEETPEPKEKKVEQSTEDYDGDEPPTGDKAQSAWMKRKNRIKELEGITANWEAKAKEWETERSTWNTKQKELEERANQWKDEERQEYQKLKERDAIEYVTQSKQYQEEAQAPWDRGNSSLAEISDYSQVDVKAIKDVLLEPNKLTRHDKLVELLSNSPKTISEARIEILAKEAMDAGDELHKAAQAHERLTKDASTKREQVAQQEKAAALKAQEEAKKVLRESIAEVDSGLKVQLKDLVDEGLLSEKDLNGGGEEFDMQQDPMDLAFGTRAAHLLPVMTKAIRSLKREIAQLKEDQRARQQARPGLKPSGATNGSKPVPDLKAAMRAHTQWVPGS